MGGGGGGGRRWEDFGGGGRRWEKGWRAVAGVGLPHFLPHFESGEADSFESEADLRQISLCGGGASQRCRRVIGFSRPSNKEIVGGAVAERRSASLSASL